MYQLLGGNWLKEQIFRQLFLQRLPTNAQLILASSPDTVSLDQLAALADKILEVAAPQPSVSPISAPAMPHKIVTSQLSELEGKINQITAQLQALSSQINHDNEEPRFRGRRQSRSKSPFSRQFRNQSQSPRRTNSLCWYHRKFGPNAQRCTRPCSFVTTETNTPQQDQQQQQLQGNATARD
eukprot:gene10668-biopygen8517